MKLKNIFSILGLIIIVSTGIVLSIGIYLFPYLNDKNKSQTTIYFGPYINNTHPCYTHAQGCSAELPNQLINYTVWSQDGSINITSNVVTGTNGFIELDLAINKDWTILMQTMINGTLYRGNTTFSTLSGSANCITTGQLKKII